MSMTDVIYLRDLFTALLVVIAALSLILAGMAAVGDWLDRRETEQYRERRRIRSRLITYVEANRACCREVARIGGPVLMAMHQRECHERRAA